MEKKLNILVKSHFGSKLYGTDTPSSDTDYKGVFLPSFEDVVLQRAKKSINYKTNPGKERNTFEDIDEQYFSLQYFFELCGKGDMVAIDLLHAPSQFFIDNVSPIWEEIHSLRHKFITKNLAGYIGYIGKQVNKYGAKGGRVKLIEDTLSILDGLNPEDRFAAAWDAVKDVEGVHEVSVDKGEKSYTYLSIAGKMFDRNAPIRMVRPPIQAEWDNVGQRALDARNNKNVDWKAVSHAVRACYQVEELLTDGDITFPLKKADFIKQIKLGKFDFIDISRILDDKNELVFSLLKKADIPDKVDMKPFNNILFRLYEKKAYERS